MLIPEGSPPSSSSPSVGIPSAPPSHHCAAATSPSPRGWTGSLQQLQARHPAAYVGDCARSARKFPTTPSTASSCGGVPGRVTGLGGRLPVQRKEGLMEPRYCCCISLPGQVTLHYSGVGPGRLLLPCSFYQLIPQLLAATWWEERVHNLHVI